MKADQIFLVLYVCILMTLVTRSWGGGVSIQAGNQIQIGTTDGSTLAVSPSVNGQFTKTIQVSMSCGSLYDQENMINQQIQQYQGQFNQVQQEINSTGC